MIRQRVDLLLLAGEHVCMSACVTSGGAPKVAASLTMHVRAPGADNTGNIGDSQKVHGYWKICDDFRVDHNKYCPSRILYRQTTPVGRGGGVPTMYYRTSIKAHNVLLGFWFAEALL